MENIFNRLQQLIAEELSADKESITLETPILLPLEFIYPFDARFSSGLGSSRISTDRNVNPLQIDAIDQVQLMIAIEKEFGIEILELEKSATYTTGGCVIFRERINYIVQISQN